MAASGGHWKSGGFVPAGASMSGGGVKFSALTNEQLIRYAARQGVTPVGQITQAQQRALNAAVKRGQLAKYPSYWGDRPTYGPPFPGAK